MLQLRLLRLLAVQCGCSWVFCFSSSLSGPMFPSYYMSRDLGLITHERTVSGLHYPECTSWHLAHTCQAPGSSLSFHFLPETVKTALLLSPAAPRRMHLKLVAASSRLWSELRKPKHLILKGRAPGSSGSLTGSDLPGEVASVCTALWESLLCPPAPTGLSC